MSRRIAFIAWTPFHYFVYRDIAEHIPHAEFISCPTWYRPPAEATSHLAKTAEFLERKGAPHRQLTELYNDSILRSFFAPYEVIVSVHSWPPLESHFGDSDWFLEKKTVRALYGTAKGLATFAPWTARFDTALAWGLYSHQFLSPLTNSHIIGNQKFDRWFQKKIDSDEIRGVKDLLNSSRKTLLYMPTHSGLSSLREYQTAIAALDDKYNVVIKLHHHSELIDREIISTAEKQRGSHTYMYGEDMDPLVLLACADAVISDSSSASAEALLAELPLIVLKTQNLEAIERHQNGNEFNGFWYSGGLVRQEGITRDVEHITREEGSYVESPRELEFVVSKVLHNPLLSQRRNELRDQLFAFQDGKSGERAAKIILDLANAPQKPQIPLLGAAARAYLTSLSKNYGREMDRLRKRISDFESS